MRLLSKQTLLYATSPLALGLSLLSYGETNQDLCTLNKYSPQLELTLKAGNTRGIGRLGGVIPIAESNRGLLFANIFGLLDTNKAQEGNFGLGYRHLYDSHILGGYAFFDQRKSELNNTFNQITLGGEYLRENFELRANAYLPLGKKERVISENKQEISIPNLNYIKVKSDLGSYEQVLRGFDVEVGGNLPNFKPLEGFISYYNFNGNGLKPVHGIRLRSSLKLNEYLSLEGEISHDRLREQQTGKKVVIFGGIKLNYTFGKKETKLTGLERKMTQMIVRDIDAITESYSKGSSRIEVELDDEYKVLGLEEGASKEDKDRAFRKLAARHHPDRGGNPEQYHRINEASEILDCLYDGDIEKLVKTKESSENFRTQVNVPQGVNHRDNHEITTSSEMSEELQEAGKDEIIELSGPKMVEEQDNQQLAIRQNSVPEVAIQEQQAVRGAYVDNFFVVDRGVREEIEGIIVQNGRQVWLVPKGVDLSSVLGKERENHGLLDFTAIHDQLIRVNTYDIKGINPNLRKKHLAMFTEQSKWEVKKYIGKKEYKVMALGPRLRGGMMRSSNGSEEERINLRSIYKRDVYEQTGIESHTEAQLKEHLRSKKESAIRDRIGRDITVLRTNISDLKNQPGSNRIPEWFVNAISDICSRPARQLELDSYPLGMRWALITMQCDLVACYDRLPSRLSDFFNSCTIWLAEKYNSSAQRTKEREESEKWFLKLFTNIAVAYKSKGLSFFKQLGTMTTSGQITGLLLPADEEYTENLSKLERQIGQKVQKERELLGDIGTDPIRELDEAYIVRKHSFPDAWQTIIENKLISCGDESGFSSVEDKKNFVRLALKLPMQHKRLNVAEALAAFERDEFFSRYDQSVRDEIVQIITQICQNSNKDPGHGVNLGVRGLFYGPPGSGKTETTKEIARLLGLPCKIITIVDGGKIKVDCDGSHESFRQKTGWLAEAFLTENDQGESFTNAIVVLDDFHTVLFDSKSKQPDNTVVGFSLELLDPEKKTRMNNYFEVELSLERLNIIVTANRPLDKKTTKLHALFAYVWSQVKKIVPSLFLKENQAVSDPVAPLLARLPIEVSFEGFSKERIRGYVTDHLDGLLESNHLAGELRDAEKTTIISNLLKGDNIDLRKIKNELQRVVANVEYKKQQRALGGPIVEVHQSRNYLHNPCAYALYVLAGAGALVVTQPYVGGLISLIAGLLMT